MSNSFKYLVIFGGGQGPDVWEAEKEVSAVDIEDALNQVKGGIEEAGGWITYIALMNQPDELSQNCYEATSKDIEGIERLEQLLLASFGSLGANHPALLDWARLRMLLKRQSNNIEALKAAVISLTPTNPAA